MARCAVVIPAFNEAATVGDVVRTALAAGVGRVVVVDDGSADATSQVAESAGGTVLKLAANRGKGAAVVAGAMASHEDVIVLLDADLLGLRKEHVVALALPVLDARADMTLGVFREGRLATTLAQRLSPQLSGQRALARRALLDAPGLDGSRFGAEVVLNTHAHRSGWTCIDVPLLGASQRMKEQKRGFFQGLLGRAGMYRDILLAMLRSPRKRGRS